MNLVLIHKKGDKQMKYRQTEQLPITKHSNEKWFLIVTLSSKPRRLFSTVNCKKKSSFYLLRQQSNWEILKTSGNVFRHLAQFSRAH